MKKKIIIFCLLFTGLGSFLIGYCGVQTIIVSTKQKVLKKILFEKYKYEQKEYLENKLTTIKKEEYYYLTDVYGEKISNKKYTYLQRAGENFYIAEKNNKYGVITGKGKTVIPFKYSGKIYFDGSYFICTNKLQQFGTYPTWHVYNKKGKFLFKSKETMKPLFIKEGFFSVTNKTRTRLINEKGKNVFNDDYDIIQKTYTESRELAFIAVKGDKYGIINLNSEILVPFEYDKIKEELKTKNTYWAKKGGKYGLINIKNEILTDFVFYSIPQKITENRYISGFIDISKDDAQKLYQEGVVVPEEAKILTEKELEELELDKKIQIIQSLRNKPSKKVIDSEGEIHCVSVYEGNYSSSKDTPGIVPIRVTVKKPITLFLSSYNAVTWKIILEKGAKVNKIYYSGYYDSKVIAPKKTQVEKVKAGNYYEKLNFKELINVCDKPPVTFQSKYSIRGEDEILIDGKDGVKYNVYPKHPSVNGKVSVKCDFGKCYDLTVEYGNMGASTTAIADKFYDKGKYYFEAKFIAPETYNTPWINIGLLSSYNNSHCSFHDPGDSGDCSHLSIMGWSENSLKNGDIVGIAVDFDNGKLYGFVNGKPKNGIIEKEKTTYLFNAGEREYAAGFEVSENIKWEINFGAKRFKYKIPNGYKPYDEYSYKK